MGAPIAGRKKAITTRIVPNMFRSLGDSGCGWLVVTFGVKPTARDASEMPHKLCNKMDFQLNESLIKNLRRAPV